MAEVLSHLTPGKRSLQHLEPLSGDDAPAMKRFRLESPPVSAHLTLLEELCDLEGEEAESCAEPLATVASTQEDLVAEMMKSLEKVIEEGESRGTGEVSSSHRSSEVLSPVLESSVLDLSWANDVCLGSGHDTSDHGELHYVDELNGDARIQHLLQVSDDELGIPLSSSSSDLDDSSFHEEWASLSDQNDSAAVLNLCWLDGPFQHFEETRELYEPVILF